MLDAAELSRGQSVLVVGASGGVGGFVAQLAEHRGLTVLTAGRDTPPADFAGMELDGLINTAPADPTRYLVAVRDGGVATSVTTPAEAERGIRSSRVGVKVDRAGLETVARLAEEGVLTTTVAATFPAAQAVEAYAAGWVGVDDREFDPSALFGQQQAELEHRIDHVSGGRTDARPTASPGGRRCLSAAGSRSSRHPFVRLRTAASHGPCARPVPAHAGPCQIARASE